MYYYISIVAKEGINLEFAPWFLETQDGFPLATSFSHLQGFRDSP